MPSSSRIRRCSSDCGFHPSVAATTNRQASTAPTPASMLRRNRTWPGTSTKLMPAPDGSVVWAKPRSIVSPRRFSSSNRSGSVPVSASTSDDLPWSTWPAVATTLIGRDRSARRPAGRRRRDRRCAGRDTSDPRGRGRRSAVACARSAARWSPSSTTPHDGIVDARRRAGAGDATRSRSPCPTRRGDDLLRPLAQSATGCAAIRQNGMSLAAVAPR